MDDHTKFSEEELDEMAVDFLAVAMRGKLAISRHKGRGGWRNCHPDYLSQLLREHVEKGDPVDVANFCAFLVSLRSNITRGLLHDAQGRPKTLTISTGRGDPFTRCANALEACDWSGSSIGNKAVLEQAITLLRSINGFTEATPAHTNTECQKVVQDLLDVIDMLMPGVRHIAIQDYQKLNEAPIAARELLAKSK